MTTHQQQSQQLLSDQSWVEDKLSGSISGRTEVSSEQLLEQTYNKITIIGSNIINDIYHKGHMKRSHTKHEV